MYVVDVSTFQYTYAFFTDGTSTVYDGTLLVEQSVARVRNPVYSNLKAAL